LLFLLFCFAVSPVIFSFCSSDLLAFQIAYGRCQSLSTPQCRPRNMVGRVQCMGRGRASFSSAFF
jgi:hypothetical protein